MGETSFETHNPPVSLKEILTRCGQPVSEEQGWALLYQGSSRMIPLGWGFGGLQAPLLRGPETILIHQDGSLTFVAGSNPDSYRNPQPETKIVECLGLVVYKALDWGLHLDVERDLSLSLEGLLRQMFRLEEDERQETCTLAGIIKICEERLFVPSEAANHYQNVCRALYEEHIELCKLLLTIRSDRENLKKMETEDLWEDVTKMDTANYGAYSWNDVIKELKRGVRLQPTSERRYKMLPVQRELFPYELLMDDIKCKRYALRKVQVDAKNKTPEDQSLNCVQLQRSLKQASDRKLKDQCHKELSLHELLMNEIKSGKRPWSASTEANADRDRSKIRRSLVFHCDDSLYAEVIQKHKGLDDKNNTKQQFTVDPINANLFEEGSWPSACGSETTSDSRLSEYMSSSTSSTPSPTPSRKAIIPELDMDLTFVPVLTSSQVDLKTNSILSVKMLGTSHQRSKSLGSSPWSEDSILHCRRHPTIAELIPVRQAMIKSEMVDFKRNEDNTMFSRSRMSMPFKQCLYLPVSFLKTVILTGHASQVSKTWQFYQATQQWDLSSVPLVFEPYEMEEVPYHRKAMKSWFTLLTCIKCEEYLLEIIIQKQQNNSLTPESRSRSTSESF
uniref:Protein spire homolog 1-like isoform X2 n=1 Tax=Geotrypetes seraphini TaxID=260995 RepID=A0A6P8SIC4_GEOSA|nr:protein spire homolog 1-like isoform X2 [Geotrypetes seraphini]